MEELKDYMEDTPIIVEFWETELDRDEGLGEIYKYYPESQKEEAIKEAKHLMHLMDYACVEVFNENTEETYYWTDGVTEDYFDNNVKESLNIDAPVNFEYGKYNGIIEPNGNVTYNKGTSKNNTGHKFNYNDKNNESDFPHTDNQIVRNYIKNNVVKESVRQDLIDANIEDLTTEGGEDWIVFYLGDDELASYTFEGTFDGELPATREDLANKYGVKPEDIKVKAITKRRTLGEHKEVKTEAKYYNKIITEDIESANKDEIYLYKKFIDEIKANLDINEYDIQKEGNAIKFRYNDKIYYAEPRSMCQVNIFDDNHNQIGWGVVVNKIKEEVFTDYTTNDYIYELVGGDYAGTYTREEAEKLPILEPELSSDDSEIRANGGFTHRKELDNQLQFKGYLGPMWNGTKDGKAIIRYETQEVYNMLSK